MRLGIMQPYFFPYLGYFSLIKHVDKFIILDDVQFIRHGWIERNRMLKQTGGWQYIAVPIKKHSQKIPIKEIVIDNSIDWKKKIIAQLVHYKKSPYYRKVNKLLENIFINNYSSITELDKICIEQVASYLDISTPIEIFRRMGLNIDKVNKADEWALNICKVIPQVSEYWNPIGGKNFFEKSKYICNGINLKFLEIEVTEYKQKNYPFEAGLSILDVMMFNSPEKINMMLDKYKLYE